MVLFNACRYFAKESIALSLYSSMCLFPIDVDSSRALSLTVSDPTAGLADFIGSTTLEP